ncbi:sulfotransferase family 2 domain-containing protein [Paracoccus saliphilus]|uniref:Sulfotransferase family 2 domain-containing protein n=1 Tax=Paracoccus saliphilus TaxID=405559 RepID=A0AA45W8P4_9RHOB|nr:sulfotransferase family 2 domain-containing protein [Paracoccus saliphilus]WCR05495.1 sulfotransferase family 2 domain-containing protein [Paracoccus saliphilus]SIT18279.1 Sulfotransferase family protein [Paracoccus saliphilus]
MIISDVEKFVFVHNPKVGGMTFRTALMPFDTRENFFFEWKEVGDLKKTLDLAHITPFQLNRFFPDVFASIESYYKFGFSRNPYSRFMSAISQHLKLCTPYIRNAVLSNEDLFYGIASEFALTSLKQDIIDQDVRMVHFRKQSNFFYYSGKIWVNDVFKLENLHEVKEESIGKYLGNSIDNPINQTSGYGGAYDITRLTRDAIRALNEFYGVDFNNFKYEKLS